MSALATRSWEMWPCCTSMPCSRSALQEIIIIIRSQSRCLSCPGCESGRLSCHARTTSSHFPSHPCLHSRTSMAWPILCQSGITSGTDQRERRITTLLFSGFASWLSRRCAHLSHTPWCRPAAWLPLCFLCREDIFARADEPRSQEDGCMRGRREVFVGAEVSSGGAHLVLSERDECVCMRGPVQSIGGRRQASGHPSRCWLLAGSATWLGTSRCAAVPRLPQTASWRATSTRSPTCCAPARLRTATKWRT